jgi:malonyl-CoA O-methyltransferase
MNHRNEHKARIAARFGAAVGRYAGASELQRDAAAELSRRVMALQLPPSPRVLEIGCGTGHLTGMLLDQLKGDWVVTDIALPMVRACARNGSTFARHVVMDGERPAFRSRSFDLIVSNFAVQWFSDLQTAFSALGELLVPGGYIALATLGRDTFSEWRLAHDRLGLQAATHDYPDAEMLARAFPLEHATRVDVQRVVQGFGEPLDFVRSLREIGADTPRSEAKPLSAGHMRKVLRELAAPECGSRITYELLYAISRRGPLAPG